MGLFPFSSLETHLVSVEFQFSHVTAFENEISVPHLVLLVKAVQHPADYGADFNVNITVKGGTAKREFNL